MKSLQADRRHRALDSVVHVITPERIVLDYPLAGPFRRSCAYLIDQFLVIGLVLVAFVVSGVVAQGSMAGWGPALVAYFLLTWGYGAFCEGFLGGQTLGKRRLGIRVLSEPGLPINLVQAILRNVVGTVDGIFPFCFLIGLASMVMSPRFQRLGDLAAGTMVVVEERRASPAVARIDEPEITALLPWLPVRIAGSSHLSRVLSDYVEIRRRFGPLRRAEMAEPLAARLRARFGLSGQASADAVLCAVYHRIFLGES